MLLRSWRELAERIGVDQFWTSTDAFKMVRLVSRASSPSHMAEDCHVKKVFLCSLVLTRLREVGVSAGDVRLDGRIVQDVLLLRCRRADQGDRQDGAHSKASPSRDDWTRCRWPRWHQVLSTKPGAAVAGDRAAQAAALGPAGHGARVEADNEAEEAAVSADQRRRPRGREGTGSETATRPHKFNKSVRAIPPESARP